MRSRIAVAAIAIACALSGATALAGQKDDDVKGNIVVRTEARLGDQTLAPGKYVARIIPGDEPMLVLSRDGKEVARAAVERHEAASSMPYDQIRVGMSATGVNEVVAVTFKGRRDTFTVRSTGQVANSNRP